jgi:hypothetical protein
MGTSVSSRHWFVTANHGKLAAVAEWDADYRTFDVKAEDHTQTQLAKMTVTPLKTSKSHSYSEALARHTMAVWGAPPPVTKRTEADILRLIIAMDI